VHHGEKYLICYHYHSYVSNKLIDMDIIFINFFLESHYSQSLLRPPQPLATFYESIWVILRKGVKICDIHFIFKFKDEKHDFSFQIDFAQSLIQRCAKTFEKNCILKLWCLFYCFSCHSATIAEYEFGVTVKFTKIYIYK